MLSYSKDEEKYCIVKKESEVKQIKKLLKIDHGWSSRAETIIFSEESKMIKWGPGSWISEPDLVEWKESCPFGEVYCRIDRVPELGSLSGFVSLPKNHLLNNGQTMLEISKVIKAHGGITYLGSFEKKRWIGFDCAHSSDFTPISNKIGNPNMGILKKYRTVEFCRHEIMEIVRQLSNYKN